MARIRNTAGLISASIAILFLAKTPAFCQSIPVKLDLAHTSFDGNVYGVGMKVVEDVQGTLEFVPGKINNALRIQPTPDSPVLIQYDTGELGLDEEHDFSVEFRMRSNIPSDQRAVLLSTRDVPDNSLVSQKQKGWTFSICNGTFAWSMGSGNRRISYERSNGEFLTVNDGRWHQLAMTHSASEGLIRLYYDGRNVAIYNIVDHSGFEFGNELPLSVGWAESETATQPSELPIFVEGAQLLQELVDEFNSLGLTPVENGGFELLVSDPDQLFSEKVNAARDGGRQVDLPSAEQALENVNSIRRRMMRSRYTVHQSSNFSEVALVFQLYRLVDGQIEIVPTAAERLATREVLSSPSFDLDDLKIWNRALSDSEIGDSFNEVFQPRVTSESPGEIDRITAGCWNIFHGGIHQTIERDGWDSRDIIIELIRREEIDVLMMQETYSNGDYIAAELGYYFATTIDWDNMHQGSNISVLSRFPIKEVHVPPDATFMNVAAKVAVEDTKDLWVMSNWYGMSSFDKVFSFHEQRFQATDSIPVLFGGDFNAVPDVDGGDNEAYRRLTDAGFVDAFREQYPDHVQNPGPTHRSGNRIDQLYYKGAGLNNSSTEVFLHWPTVFPSDHYLIKTVFELDYSTSPQTER
ncbi:MAG: endonuclease/exonuclease/phosphatase family protein [Planctomycetota bacterium]